VQSSGLFDIPVLGSFLSDLSTSSHKYFGKRKKLLHDYKVNTIWDDFFMSLMKKFECDLVIECGASDGEISRRAVTELKMKAIAIEANPSTFNILTKELQKSGVVVINAAVSDSVGEGVFYVPISGKTDSSSSLYQKEGIAYIQHKVKKVTVESVVEEFLVGGNRIALWIDVEGGGFQVLKGAQSILKKISLIRVELEDHSIFSGQLPSSATIKFLSAQNFTPLICGPELSRGQRDWVFVKSDEIKKCSRITLKLLNDISALNINSFEVLKSMKLRDFSLGLKCLVFSHTPERWHSIIHLVFASFGSISSSHVLNNKTENRTL